jgi:hypothetical protein
MKKCAGDLARAITIYNHMQKMFIIIICANKFQMETCDVHIVIQFLIIKLVYLVLFVCGKKYLPQLKKWAGDLARAITIRAINSIY